jgi:ganglioside GM2 activator
LQKGPSFHVLNFSWKDCTENGAAMKISDVKVGPDPVEIPGNISVAFELKSTKDLVKGNPFFIRIKKKVGPFWVNVPCENGVGSCDYPDFCEKWPIPGPKCPDAYIKNGVPCECPLKAGHYTLPYTDLGHLNNENLPAWLENGSYHLTAWVTPKGQEKAMLCVELKLELKSV